MQHYTIQRETPLPDGTFSVMTDDDGNRICHFLEPAVPFAAARGLLLLPYLSPKHGYVVPCYQNILGHTVIEQHPGNDKEDTEDCQVPGDSRGKVLSRDGTRLLDAVLNSKKMFVALMHLYGFPDYALDLSIPEHPKITTSLTTPAALRAFLAANPDAGQVTMDVLDATPIAA